VRAVDGSEWRFVRAAKSEMTCRRCGETTITDYCVRCSDSETGEYVRDLVPTLSYLHEDEYVLN